MRSYGGRSGALSVELKRGRADPIARGYGIGPSQRWTFTARGCNITRQHDFIELSQTPFAGALGGNKAVNGQTLLRGFEGAPRIFGVKVRVKF